ncbi:MAG: pyridoxal 5'-phosphate synthase glutaminase subunit PdxT [Micrococcales bacterium]
MTRIKIVGVLALQGDVREHKQTLESLGVEVREVRTPDELSKVDALVIPGGESTTISKLSEIFGMLEPIREAISSGLPVLGTCAGLIMLGRILDPASDQKSFGGLNVAIRRNAFGNQNDSFEADIDVVGIDGPIHAAFIRAPIVESVDPGVEVIAKLGDGRIVGVRQGKCIGISFHPEVTGDNRIHKLLVDSI